MKILILALVLLLGLGLAVHALQQAVSQPAGPRPLPYKTFEMPASAVEVPMLDGLLAIVEVRINGQGAYRFGIDTGAAGGAIINQSLADKLGLPVVGQAMTGDPSGKSRHAVNLVGIDKLEVGGATFGGLTASGSQFEALGVDGILGIRLFSESLLTLDYPHHRVRIERGELPAADGKTVLTYDGRMGGIPMITLHLGDAEVQAHVDSGNTRSEIVVPAALTSRLKFSAEPVSVGKAKTVSNELDVRQAPLAGNLVLGSYELQNPRVDIVDLIPFANVGHKFLQRFTVTVDSKNSWIRFEPQTATPKSP
jgi:hypothetical protein